MTNEFRARVNVSLAEQRLPPVADFAPYYNLSMTEAQYIDAYSELETSFAEMLELARFAADDIVRSRARCDRRA